MGSIVNATDLGVFEASFLPEASSHSSRSIRDSKSQNIYSSSSDKHK